MPTKLFYQIAAYAVGLATAAPAAHAVIFHSTGDPTFNTTAPAGALANSGWQYQVDIGPNLGTAVGPHHYLTAVHTGASTNNTFTYNGVTYHTTGLVATFGSQNDLGLFAVDNTFLSYAPLYDTTTDPTEVNKDIVVVGKGTQRGDAAIFGGTQRGWFWGATDSVRRWGQNRVTGTANSGQLIRMNFDNPGLGANEAVASSGDSGGGVFIADANGQYKLAGVTFAVSGPYSFAGGEQFTAAIYNTTGMTDYTTGVGVPATEASGFYAHRVANAVNGAGGILSFLNLPPTWKTNANGNWTTASNWGNTASAPNAIGAIADFRTVINAARNVSFSGTVTVGTINFDNANSYSLVPGVGSANQLHLNVASGNAAVNVASGNHNIIGLHLDDPTTFNIVQSASTLTTSISSAAGQAITKTGAGTLAVNRLVSGAVTVSQGTLKVNPGGASVTTSKVTGGVSVDSGAGAKLDLSNNDMVVANTPVGSKVGSSYTGLTGLIAQSYTFGDWTGPGITSINAGASGGLTTLGIASGNQVFGITGTQTEMWSGQTVGANDTLIAYTYAGDANLDGVIDGGDYGVIDNFVQVPGASGYANGDFNYDGVIDGGDYGIIDNNIQAQGGPLITSAPQSLMTSGVSAVPEPAATSLVAFASMAFLKRRRRRADA